MEQRPLQHKQKQTPWPLVRERTIPTDRPPLVCTEMNEVAHLVLVRVRVRVTLRLTVGQSVCLGVEPRLITL
jgi:hypothetical protein